MATRLCALWVFGGSPDHSINVLCAVQTWEGKVLRQNTVAKMCYITLNTIFAFAAAAALKQSIILQTTLFT